MSSQPPDDLYLHIQGLAGGTSAIYDEVEDVRQLLDGLGDVIQSSSATSPKNKSTLHRNADFASVRNLRYLLIII